MYAVVRIAGQQFEVRPKERLRVPLLHAEIGARVEFDEVLLVRDEQETRTGTPHLAGAMVTAQVVGHGRDEKIVVFRKRRRKDSKKRNGHRQPFSEIEVEEIRLS